MVLRRFHAMYAILIVHDYPWIFYGFHTPYKRLKKTQRQLTTKRWINLVFHIERY